MKKFLSCQEISDSSHGREDGFHRSLESVASVMIGQRKQKRLWNGIIFSILLPLILCSTLSVDLEKAIRLQAGQMTYKFERLGLFLSLR